MAMVAVSDMSWRFGLLCICVLTQGIHGTSTSSDSSDGGTGTDTGLETGLVVGGVACVVVLVVVIALCVEKRIHVETMDRGPPYWTRNLEFIQTYNGGLSAVSDGMNNLSPFHVIRDRLGRAVTDGARWDVGFTQGKHVFEVVWPVKKNRGTNSSIGMATSEVPIKKPGRISLVGHHSQSWGFDLSSRKMVHSNKRTGSFQKQFPDRFFVYVDMDGGKVGFGEDVKALGMNALFYGNLVTGIKTDRTTPMYLTVGMCAPREEVQIYYIGSAVQQGGFSLIPPEPVPTQVVVYTTTAPQQPDMAPQPVVPSAPTY